MALRLYDTATDQLRPTAPGATAKMYVCGITPYDATHLGHAATYITFDLVNRIWRDNGHTVHFVQNVTDIDDPLLERAARDHDDWQVLALRETALFREDMEALRVLPPDDYIGVVEAMDEVIDVVQRLIDAGAAYPMEDGTGDIYFDITAGGHFGYESRYDHATMLEFFAERGGDPDRPGKRNTLDALVWRGAREGEPQWDSPMGPGRPGWHVECSAIAVNRLGLGFDLQGGGSDLRFPHHEMSASHAEVARGGWPFARHYVHTGMIGLDGAKMSKSKGNLEFVSRLRANKVDPAAIRLGLLDGHYRSDRDWNSGVLEQAEKRLELWRSAAAAPAGEDPTAVIAELRRALSDDLDTPGALATIDHWASRSVHSQDGMGVHGGAGTAIATAVDALLGVALLPG